MAFKGFGKAKYGNDYGHTWSPVEGDNLIRVLPPMHSLADAGKWSQYWGIHFGYSGVDPSDPTKTRQRPFLCIQEKGRNGMVAQNCPACDARDAVEAQLKEKEAQLIAAGTDAETIATQLAPMAAWLKSHNVDRKHYLNVMIPSGEVGHFKLSHRTKKALDAKMQEVQDQEKLDPIDPDQGVWFNIKRTGKMLSVVDVVELVFENVKIDGRTLKDIKKAPLTEEQAEKALSDCKDLALVGTSITYDQIKQLAESSGDPAEIDAIFFGTVVAAKSKPVAAKEPANVADKVATEVVKAEVVKAEPITSGEVVQPVTTNIPADIQERVAAIKAKKAAEAAAQAKAAEEALKAAAPAVDPVSMSDEEFLKQFG